MLPNNLGLGSWSFVLVILIICLGRARLCSSGDALKTQNSTDIVWDGIVQPRVTLGEFVLSTLTFPSFVYLPASGGCAGVLISPNLILTAAHCLLTSLQKLVSVAGTVDNPLNGMAEMGTWQQRQALRKEVHPNWGKLPKNFDIGVLEVCPFILNPHVNVVPNFARTLSAVKPNSGIVVGYGVATKKTVLEKFDTTRRDDYPAKLLMARQIMRDALSCKQKWMSYVNRVPDMQKIVRMAANTYLHPQDNTQICGFPWKSGQGQCSGDSGGPLYCESRKGRKALCGIVSMGLACGDDAIPGVYTSFGNNDIFQWIREQQRMARTPNPACRQMSQSQG